MNYLVAVDHFHLDQPGGAARVAWDIAQVIRGRGHNVTIFCYKSKSDTEEVYEYKGIRLVRFVMPHTTSLDPFKLHKKMKAGIEVAQKHLTGTKWDIIHIHITQIGLILHKALGSDNNFVYTMHSPDVMEQEINWNSQGLPGKIKLLFGKKQIKKMENKALDISQRIHALSNFTKEAIHQLYGLGEKVTVIPHWCRNDFFRTNSKGEARRILNWPRDVKIIFSVRRLVARMGLDDAIKAAATLLKEHPDTYFAIAGTGPLMRPLKQMVQALGISDKVWFLGRVDDDTLKRFYEAADLYVLPTRSLECFGLIVLEALAFGLPIISTDAGAIPELMKPILPNCIVPAGSVKKLRERIECFFRGSLDIPNNDKLVDYVKKKFSSDTIVPKILDFLATDTT